MNTELDKPLWTVGLHWSLGGSRGIGTGYLPRAWRGAVPISASTTLRSHACCSGRGGRTWGRIGVQTALRHRANLVAMIPLRYKSWITLQCGGRTVWEDRYIGQQCGIWRDEISSVETGSEKHWDWTLGHQCQSTVATCGAGKSDHSCPKSSTPV